MNNNLMTLNAVLQAAVAEGASSYYTPFKEAIFEDAEVKAALVAVAQGPKRVAYFMPQDVGIRFAKAYAAKHQKKVKEAPITEQPVQMELPLESDDRLNRLEALVIANHNRLINIERLVHQLAKTWEALEDDQK